MKPKNPIRSRQRVKFSVDREEIEVNSDWVAAVMASPRPPVPQAVVTAEAIPGQNTATGTDNPSGTECCSVEVDAPVENSATDDLAATVAPPATVVNKDTGADSSAVAISSKGASPDVPTANTATGEERDESYQLPAGTNPIRRVARPRPIYRITDGLTPGQYAVYHLMYEEGKSAEDGARIYAGGYADLRRLTGLSKRGVQNVVGELQRKQVIRIHQKPGHHREESSAYFVPAPEKVLETWRSRGWRHAAGKSKTLLILPSQSD